MELRVARVGTPGFDGPFIGEALSVQQNIRR